MRHKAPKIEMRITMCDSRDSSSWIGVGIGIGQAEGGAAGYVMPWFMLTPICSARTLIT